MLINLSLLKTDKNIACSTFENNSVLLYYNELTIERAVLLKP